MKKLSDKRTLDIMWTVAASTSIETGTLILEWGETTPIIFSYTTDQ